MTKWYCACLLYEAVHELDEADSALWEENIVLFQAETEGDAIRQAEELGPKREDTFQVNSPSPHWVRREFRGVESAYDIAEENLGSGVEVFSRLLGAEEAAHLVRRSRK